jgi:hypothetical protein
MITKTKYYSGPTGRFAMREPPHTFAKRVTSVIGTVGAVYIPPTKTLITSPPSNDIICFSANRAWRGVKCLYNGNIEANAGWNSDHDQREYDKNEGGQTILLIPGS